MDKLEQYLDQVCRSIGGPKSLRQHVRQELREHLLDAVAEHKAAGMPEEQALARALADFGGPEEVRTELEAAHGYRLWPLVIDRAMQWKEKTMRAKWLWTTWANLTVLGVIVLEVFTITFANVYLVPKYQRLTRDGLIDQEGLQETGIGWMSSFLRGLDTIGGKSLYILLGSIAGWALFEWRVRSENKSFIRLSVLGTVAVGLVVVVILQEGSMVIPYMVSAPAMNKIARPYALEQINRIENAVHALENGLAKKDWETMTEQANRAVEVGDRLAASPAAVGALTAYYGHPTPEELRAALRSANECLLEARQASREKDTARLQAALAKFHEHFEPISKAARKSAR